MNNVVEFKSRVPAMTDQAVEKVRALENVLLELPQVEIKTHHVLHGGMYARTIKIPAGVMLTGVLINVATTLIVNGDCNVWVGDQTVHLEGHHVLAASANRKQAFMAVRDTYLTMVFATNATTIEQAEEEFTSEAHLLMSRQAGHENTIIITGE
jgi:hypothetical protein